MPKLIVTTREGETSTVEGQDGLSAMEVIRDAGFDELMALCGGERCCATCHVYVAEEFLDRVPPMGQDEDDLLDSSEHRKPMSRLSCQIPFGSDLNELHVTIAPED